MELNRKINQFLVHSFLYYKLDESIIEDYEYDKICVDLKSMIDSSVDYIYKDLIEKSLGSEGSGFSIRKYPPKIISSAFHLLYQEKYKDIKPFDIFVKTYGYKIT